MQTNFIQPSGTTSVQSSAEVLSQLLNIPQSSIGSIERGVDLTNFSFAIDPATKEIYNVTGVLGSVTGMVASGTTAVVSTENGSFSVNAFPSVLTTISIPTIADLRKFEPWYEGQHVVLERAIPDGPLINTTVIFDPSDSTSQDNDFSILVTGKGKRWKVDVSKGIDVELAGLKTDGTNLGTVLNKIILAEVNKIVSAKDYKVSPCKIKIKNISSAQTKSTFYLDKSVIIPSFFTIEFHGPTDIYYSGKTGFGLKISNSEFYTQNGLKGWDVTYHVNTQGQTVLNGIGGTVSIRGLGAGVIDNQATGLIVGNDITSSDVLNVRDVKIKNLHIEDFKIGLDITVKNTYIINFDTCIFSFNYYNISNSVIDVSNGGERFSFENCTIGNATSHNIYWNCVGAGVTFSNCSIDYAGGSAVCFALGGRNNHFKFTNGTWIEGWGRYLLEEEAPGSWGLTLQNAVTFDTCYILGKKTDGSYSGQRPIFYNRFVKGKYSLVNTLLEFPSISASPYCALVDLGSKGNVDLSIINPSKKGNSFLGDYNKTLNGGAFNFSGTVGANVKNLVDTGTNLTVQTLNDTGSGFTIVYGEKDISDSNTYTQVQSIVVTTDNATSRFHLYNGKMKVGLNPTEESIKGSISVKSAGVSSGDLTFNLRLSIFSLEDLTTSIKTIYGSDVKLSSYLTATGTTATKNNFVAVEVLAEVSTTDLVGVYGSIVVVPSIQVVGAVGNYEIRTPAFWKSFK